MKMVTCRVQDARSQKGMELHPCKSVGEIEYAGFARTIDGVSVGVMIRDSEPGRAKMSVRTAAGYNASAYCGKLGGGGHAAAAGCSIPGTLEDGKAAILQVLREENVI